MRDAIMQGSYLRIDAGSVGTQLRTEGFIARCNVALFRFGSF